MTRAGAGELVRLARRLAAMPATRHAWVDGVLSQGQIEAIAANVPKRLLGRWRSDEAALVPLLAPLTPEQTAQAVRRWRQFVDEEPGEPERPGWLFHAKTLDGRYDTRGEFDPETGAIIDIALAAAMGDRGRSGPQERTAAQRRADALADSCEFFVRHTQNIDAEAPVVPKRTPFQLCAIITTHDLRHGTGGRLLDGTTLDQPTIDRWVCDAQLQRLITDPDGAIKQYELLPATVTEAL
jgi:hypothetical protein